MPIHSRFNPNTLSYLNDENLEKMPKLIFTQEEIDNYVKEKTFHVFYRDTIAVAEAMDLHATGGKNPDGTPTDRLKKIIWERRPNEPQEVMDYRLKIITPKTKPTFSKIFSSLQKIRRSSDWSIRYEGEYPKIAEGETLEDYADENYPGFTSLTNWVFTLLLRKYLIDPNAVVYVAPISKDVQVNQYLQPIAQVFDSKNVIDFVEGDYAVLLNPVGAVFYSGGKPMKGKRYIVCTTMQILTYDQVDGRQRFQLTDTYDHELGYLPAFKLKGVIVEQNTDSFLYESRISGILPELDEAIREYSDLQAAKVLHIYPERWEFTQFECTTCKGTGKRQNPLWHTGCDASIMAHIDCNAPGCRSGYVVSGPYSKIMVKPAGMGEQSIPTPPAGYVEKDVEIVKLMEESIDAHIYSALSAINFEFLSNTPLSESGKAKEVDKDELNNTVHSIAEDIVAAMDNIYWLIALWRYRQLYGEEEISDMVPLIPVPEKYDILSSDHLQQELTNAKTSKFNPALLNQMEIEYADKKYYTDPTIRNMVQLILTLDPLANITEDDKMSRLSNKGITLESYVVSSNIEQFIRRAIEESKGFVDKATKDQRIILSNYAKEVIALTEPVQVVDSGLNEDGSPVESDGDLTGKIPLAVQQLSLAATRASDAGDTALAATIKAKINQLLAKLVDEVNPVNA